MQYALTFLIITNFNLQVRQKQTDCLLYIWILDSLMLFAVSESTIVYVFDFCSVLALLFAAHNIRRGT